jgi:hypothetical protein
MVFGARYECGLREHFVYAFVGGILGVLARAFVIAGAAGFAQENVQVCGVCYTAEISDIEIARWNLSPRIPNRRFDRGILRQVKAKPPNWNCAQSALGGLKDRNLSCGSWLRKNVYGLKITRIFFLYRS